MRSPLSVLSAWRVYARLLCLLVLLSPGVALAAQVSARLDRNQVSLGDTVTLNIEIDGANNASQPDLSPLQQDFDVVGTSTSSSIQIVNGVQSSSLIWGVALRPKRVGTLTVPALQVAGGRTAPLTLLVTPPAPASSAAREGQPVFMEAALDSRRAYVGQQLVYTVKLFLAGGLAQGSGSLDPPDVPGANLAQLGNDVEYQTQRAGRSYEVIERRYSFTVLQPGELSIPPTSFQGVLPDPNDPGGFFGGGTPVSAQSPALSVEVLPRPAGAGNDRWLPAHQLDLKLSGLPDSGPLHVGQAVNVTMEVDASGLAADSLPPLSLPTLDGATVYPDKASTGTRKDGGQLISFRRQGFAIVPDRAGTLTIPETVLRWFDVDDGQFHTARLPARQFQVIGGAAASTPSSAATGIPAAAAASAVSAPARSPVVALPWRTVALVSLALLVVCLLLGGIGWWRWRRRPAVPPPPCGLNPAAATVNVASDRRALREAFRRAAAEGDPRHGGEALLAWARSERPLLRNLGELAAALGSPAQRAAIEALQRQRYARDAGGLEADAWRNAFAEGFAWRGDASTDDDGLPPLYPF